MANEKPKRKITLTKKEKKAAVDAFIQEMLENLEAYEKAGATPEEIDEALRIFGVLIKQRATNH